MNFRNGAVLMGPIPISICVWARAQVGPESRTQAQIRLKRAQTFNFGFEKDLISHFS